MHLPGHLWWSLIKEAIAVATVAVLCLVIAMALLFRQPTWLRAQTPAPAVNFANVLPGFPPVPSGADGIVVEGLLYEVEGGPTPPGCGTPSAGEAAQATVYWLQQGFQVWTEVSLYAPCGKTISQFQNDIAGILSYVVNNAPSGSLYRWHGFMLDEESAWGFTVDELVSLNGWMANVMVLFTEPPNWFSTESFSGQGDWAQNEFNGITYASYPAPQIATDYMAQLTNSFYQSFGTNTLVTWSSTADYPANYDSEAESVNAVTGTPYAVNIGGKTFYYSNEFCPGSCM